MRSCPDPDIDPSNETGKIDKGGVAVFNSLHVFRQRFTFVTVTEYNQLQRLVRVLTRLSCRFRHLLWVVYLKRLTKREVIGTPGHL